jgi:NAD(P)-dependent dehydrogenase (short-subunit alcohol dehydrogenase family)
MLTSVRDAVAVVTGGASGIGRALARRFAAEGARQVVVLDLDGAAAGDVAADLPGGSGYRLDVTNEEALAELVERIEVEVGPIDLWCSNAGVLPGGGLGTNADWDRCWRVHTLAHLYAARHVLPRMLARGRGHLMLTASAAGLLAATDTAAYSVTKHATVALAEWLAIEHGGEPVGFSCLCPQVVRTAMLDATPAGATVLATGPILEPEQVADAVVAALAEGRFLILPHPEVAEYERRRAADRDRWLAGMRRLRDHART